MEPKKRVQIVDAALELLGLAKVRDFVCDKNLTKARLSGGQLRRVGIGVELVTLPSILLLDEPTSALDAVNTRLVVKALKVLSARGILVMASVHQPRFSVYQLFDTLVVLRQGEFILANKRPEALPFFAAHGFVPDAGENPADFFIEVAFGFIKSSKGVSEADLAAKMREKQAAAAAAAFEQRSHAGMCQLVDFDKWFRHAHPSMLEGDLAQGAWERAASLLENRDASRVSLDRGGSSKVYLLGDILSSASRRLTGGVSPSRKLSDANVDQQLPWEYVHLAIERWPLKQRALPYWHTQFAVCTKRYALKLMRTRRELATRCVLFVLLGLLCGTIMGTNPSHLTVPVFLILITSAFSCIIGTITLKSLGDGPLERDFFRHEALLGVSQVVECLSRMVLDVLAFAILPFLFGAPLLGLTALHIDMGDAYIYLLMIAWAYTSIAYLVALLGPNNSSVLYIAISFVLAAFLAGAFGLTVKDAVKAPGLMPPYVPCQIPAVCNGSRNTTANGLLTDGYMDTTGYGVFAVLPGFWGLFTMMMLWAEALPFAQVRSCVIFNM